MQLNFDKYHIRVPSVNQGQVLQGPDFCHPVAVLYAGAFGVGLLGSRLYGRLRYLTSYYTQLHHFVFCNCGERGNKSLFQEYRCTAAARGISSPVKPCLISSVIDFMWPLSYDGTRTCSAHFFLYNQNNILNDVIRSPTSRNLFVI